LATIYRSVTLAGVHTTSPVLLSPRLPGRALMPESTAPTFVTGFRLRLPFLYERLVLWGRIRGAVRVLIGKNASVPVGEHNTAIGLMRVRSYYGGLTLSLPECDIYWDAHK